MYRILDDLVHIVGDFVCFSDDLFSTPEKLVYSSEDLVNKTEHLVDISEDLIHRAGQLVYIQSRRHYLEDPVYDSENTVNVSDAQKRRGVNWRISRRMPSAGRITFNILETGTCVFSQGRRASLLQVHRL